MSQPAVLHVLQALVAAVGDGQALEQTMRSAQEDRAQLEKMLAAMQAAASSEGDAAAKAEAQQKAWEAEEATLRAQLAAQKEEAEKLIASLDAAGALKEGAGEATGGSPQTSPHKGSAAKTKKELAGQVARYERAVHSAWEDIQRAQKQVRGWGVTDRNRP